MKYKNVLLTSLLVVSFFSLTVVTFSASETGTSATQSPASVRGSQSERDTKSVPTTQPSAGAETAPVNVGGGGFGSMPAIQPALQQETSGGAPGTIQPAPGGGGRGSAGTGVVVPVTTTTTGGGRGSTATPVAVPVGDLPSQAGEVSLPPVASDPGPSKGILGFLDRALEGIRDVFTFNPENQYQNSLDTVQERIDELNEYLRRPVDRDPSEVETLSNRVLNAYSSFIDKAIEKGPSVSGDVDKITLQIQKIATYMQLNREMESDLITTFWQEIIFHYNRFSDMVQSIPVQSGDNNGGSENEEVTPPNKQPAVQPPSNSEREDAPTVIPGARKEEGPSYRSNPG